MADANAFDLTRLGKVHIDRVTLVAAALPVGCTATSLAGMKVDRLITPVVGNGRTFRGMHDRRRPVRVKPQRAQPTADRTIATDKRLGHFGNLKANRTAVASTFYR